MNKKVISIFGTRPEAIKMAPVVKVLEKAPGIESKVCLTGQHAEMLDQVLDFFHIQADYNLEVMQGHPQLNEVYARILTGLQTILQHEKPDMILVHGDTATTAAASMAAFFLKIPVGHVEAGLRTGNMYSPWPEEFNRRLAGLITEVHFAPTEQSKRNLLEEKVNPVNIAVTGNTVIDSLFLTLDQLSRDRKFQGHFYEKYPFAKTQKKLILVTGHRRENFGQGLANTCSALLDLSQRDDVEIVYPVHLNPNVKNAVHESLGGHENIHLIPPMDYNEFVYLMKHAYLVVTDSGGIQEEAPSLGKPVLVTRNTTERPEAVQAGTVELVGTDRVRLLSAATRLLEDAEEYQKRSSTQNPYGDGKASLKILEKLYDHFGPMDRNFELVPPTIFTVVKLLQ